ncbi:outer membrane beta-barrel protein [Fulvivirga sediminis]|uniref:Outer membrane beta-barrel protein n=1 Tax=Fulvivirga sediminis TaxID=2803949 RepID=A0A937F441_9BACT|nr:outer membrane beta-barrel protein [Fulvivirga sediminis]MBL3656001.1 outer membrane beta-barrel protein [Fulvivirga sediminis]
MSIVIYTIMCVLCWQTARAQMVNKKRGFVGINIGPSMPLNNYDFITKTGTRANVDVGYYFGKYIGVNISAFASTNTMENTDMNRWSYGGIMAGPLLSYNLSKIISFDLRPMVGYSITMLPIHSNFYFQYEDKVEKGHSIVYNAGASVKYALGSRLQIPLNVDYMYTNPQFDKYNINKEVESISITTGFYYRF